MKIVFPEYNNPIIQQACEESPDLEYIKSTTLTQACEVLKSGAADAMIAGIDHSTRDVILACRDLLGVTGQTFSASCYMAREALSGDAVPVKAEFLQNPYSGQCPDGNPPSGVGSSANSALADTEKLSRTLPSANGGASDFLLADIAACKNPTEDQLYDICIQTHATATSLFPEPRLALLSFSTGSSGGHDPSIDKIRAVLARLNQEHPEIIADGEMQLDCAVNPRVAAKKAPGSAVAGRANVLICPDLNSGNLLYKSLEYFGGFHAAGPLLQGFAYPVSDLSRGSTVADVKLTIDTLRRIYG